jgi:hypothetical protein
MPRLSPQAAAACVPAEVVEDHDVYPAPRMIRMAIDGALVVVAVAAILVWLVLALLHLGDRYKVGHVQGHWMALAQYANHRRCRMGRISAGLVIFRWQFW